MGPDGDTMTDIPVEDDGCRFPQERVSDAWKGLHSAYGELLAAFNEAGYFPEGSDHRATPDRVVRALSEMLEGYVEHPHTVLGKRFSIPEGAAEEVVVRDIPFWSLCEHHMLPFYGTADVRYLPTKQVVGLSKIPRLVHAMSHRLQLQERLTTDIADALWKNIDGIAGVMVRLKGRHTCMMMRGVKCNGEMETVTTRGAYRRGGVSG